MAKRKEVNPSDERKDGAYLLRCGEQERARWEQHARREGRTLAAWLRFLANREIDRLE